MGKIRVEELAQQMGLPSKEVLFLLQSIGVDVKSPQAALDETTVLAILQGRTHAPKQLIVRDTESRAVRPQKSALNRIKVIEKPPSPPEGAAGESAPAAASAVAESASSAPASAPAAAAPPARPRSAAAERAARAAAAAEPARTAVVPSEPEAEAAPEPPKPPPMVPRKIVLPPRPVVPPRPSASAGAPRPAGPINRPMGPAAGRPMGPAAGRPMGPAAGRPMGPAAGRPMGPSVYRPTPGGPGARPMGGPPRPGAPVGRTAPAGPERGPAKRKKDDKEDQKKAAAGKRGARPKITVADEVDLREFVGTYKEDTYSDISLPLIEKTGDEAEAAAQARPASKSAIRRAAKETRAHDSGKLLEFRKPAPTGPVFFTEGVTVKELSEKLGVLARDIQRLLMQRGVLATVNQTLDASTAVQIAKEIGVEAAVVSFEEELDLSRSAKESVEGAAPGAPRVPRAPVVTVMGHVDHGKTSLLDAIRQTNVAAGEAGGITQHIGAYRVEVNGKPIVFLDTPGHEAFTSMRARGAKATDIVVLVVAADDAVMPQTIEAIAHAKAAKVPIVVAINKIDKPNANIDRVKKELADQNVLLEAWGGETPAAEISALKKQGIEHLLELILLVAEMQELTAPAAEEARGAVLESRREAGRGNVATVLVQAGTLKVGDVFFAGSVFGRVRSMHNDRGEKIEAAGPATPVEVTGFEDMPQAGDTFQVVADEAKARSIVSFRQLKEREQAMASSSRLSLEQLFSKIQEGKVKDLPIILKTDVSGSMEVLSQSLKALSNEKVKISLLHAGVGAVTINDVLLASASGAIIVGFNVRPEKKAAEEAEKAGVEIRLHTVIYNVTDEIKKAMEGLLDPTLKEVVRGRAEVRNTFKVPKFGVVAGCYVTEGTIPRSAQLRLLRDNRVIHEGKVGSLRRFKDDVSEVKQGFECGIGLDRYQDIKVGDVIEAFQVEKVAGVMGALSRQP